MRLQVGQCLLHRGDEAIGRLLEQHLLALRLEVTVLLQQLPGQTAERHGRHQSDRQEDGEDVTRRLNQRASTHETTQEYRARVPS